MAYEFILTEDFDGDHDPPYIVMRIYWPKEAALNGSWLPPAVQRIE